MKPPCSLCCKGCQFYHGADRLVCTVHPYGPQDNTCSDFAPKPKTLNQKTPVKSGLDDSVLDYNIKRLLLKFLILIYSFALMAWLTKISPSTIRFPSKKLPTDVEASYNPIVNEYVFLELESLL